MPDLERSVMVDATADEVYALVSDLPCMPEWSPECYRVTWRGGATGPEPGARFIGWNRRGPIRWFTQGVVAAAEPGRRFAFDIHFGFVPVARWTYEVAPTPSGGCALTETWTDRRPGWFRVLAEPLVGRRRVLNAAGMERTLANLKVAAEAGH